MKIIDNSSRMTKFSDIEIGTVFKADNEYFIKIDSIYECDEDNDNEFYRNAIALRDYKAYSFDKAYEVYAYYDVTLSLK